ncbi:Dihydroneopterin aldolase [Cedecea neteri]|uniref:Dihydroneopterin aldolase n=1 Tax=Cedecea neteri TaxID=158822 RepID=A0A2X2SX96_9ENTR|nr:Dihydroneopterin aldolase [Cedecea neteri]
MRMSAKLFCSTSAAGVLRWSSEVAEEVAELLLTRFNSPWIRLKVSKPGAVAQAANVGVIIEAWQ